MHPFEINSESNQQNNNKHTDHSLGPDIFTGYIINSYFLAGKKKHY